MLQTDYARQRIQQRNRRIVLGVLILLLLVEAVGLSPRLTTPVERLELMARNAAFRLRGPRQPATPIAIVAIDDFSFNWTGYNWPWPRAYLAQIVQALNRAGARLIGLDIFLFEASTDPEGDTALSDALAQAPLAAGVMQIFEDPEQHTITLKLPLPAYREAYDILGNTQVLLDPDAHVRRVHAAASFQDQVYPHWAIPIAEAYLGRSLESIPLEPEPDGSFALRVNFAGPSRTFPTYSAAKVVEGDYPDEAFQDRIVLIGVTTETLHDIYPTPYDVAMPGVEIVANAIDTLVSGQFIRVTAPWVEWLLTLIAAGLSFLLLRRSTTQRLVGLGGGIGLLAATWWAAFAFGNRHIPLASPAIMLILGTLLPATQEAVIQELEKQRLRQLFARFVAPEMVDQLLQTQDLQSLNKRAHLTILFSDIRNFTTISEQMTPLEIVQLLNQYLARMSRVILQHGGTIDKYEGDAILAFFGAPIPLEDHAQRAVLAALDMRKELQALKAEWKQQGLSLADSFEIGIGINTGDVFVGLLGSKERLNYTVIGDVVNVAARLQDQTKVFQWPILISESTRQELDNRFEVECAGAPMLKGKTEPVSIYKVLGMIDDQARDQGDSPAS